MALEVEGVVGGGVHGDEALGGTCRLEPLHLAFSSAERLVRDLGPVMGMATIPVIKVHFSI